MKKIIKFPSIDQFRTVVSNVNRRYTFTGLNEQGEAVYDNSLPKPIITFTGTCKVHGTNASVCYNNVSGMWYQSRENIITVTKDNAGFAWFADANTEVFQSMFNEIAAKESLDLDNNTITIYGEWAGKGIQKNVAVNGMPKTMFIFGVKVSPFTTQPEDVDNGEVDTKAPVSYWVDSSYLKSPDHNIYNILDFPTFSIDVDFNMPQLAINNMIDMTIAVEKECPVGKFFGISGIGEGIVFSAEYKGDTFRFKSKGELHSVSRVKTLNSVDVEKLNSVVEFIGYAVTENRISQAIENVFPNNEPISINKIGDVIRWVINDIIKEESDTMVKNGIEPKDANKYISGKAKELFIKRLQQFSV